MSADSVVRFSECCANPNGYCHSKAHTRNAGGKACTGVAHGADDAPCTLGVRGVMLALVCCMPHDATESAATLLLRQNLPT